MAGLIAPKTLAEVWQLPVGAFNQGMRGYEQAQAYDDQTMAQRGSEEAYKTQERPLTLEQLAGQNRNRNAELPGIKARSTVASNAADFDNATYDQRMESWAAENKGKITKAHFDEFQRAGPIMQQLAEQAAYNPSPGINKAIREQMIRMGVGGMWNPEWDNADPKDLSAGLYDFGSAMTNALPSVQKMMAQLEGKAEIAREGNDTKLKLQRMRQEASALAAKIRGSGGKASTSDKRNLQQAITKAAAEGDFEMAEYLMNTAKYIQREPYQKPTMDIPNMPMKEAPRTPMPTPPVKGNSPAPKADPLGIR